MKTIKKILLVGAIAALPGVSQATGISNAEMSATTCFMCHGPGGKYVGESIPPLAGYPAKLMAEQLKAYKSGKRSGTIMQKHAKGYTDEELDAIAAYIGTLKP